MALQIKLYWVYCKRSWIMVLDNYPQKTGNIIRKGIGSISKIFLMTRFIPITMVLLLLLFLNTNLYLSGKFRRWLKIPPPQQNTINNNNPEIKYNGTFYKNICQSPVLKLSVWYIFGPILNIFIFFNNRLLKKWH